MLILVTVETQQLPIASVRRVVVVIVIRVMNGELAKLLSGKVAPAPRAHGRKQLQRVGSVAVAAPFAIGASPGNDVVQVVVAFGFCRHQRLSAPPRPRHMNGAADPAHGLFPDDSLLHRRHANPVSTDWLPIANAE